MPTITFVPLGKSITVPKGTGLIEAAQKVGLRIEMSCGGEGTCGKCKVKIIKGRINSDSDGFLDPGEIAQGYVLMCKTRTGSGPITVEFSQGTDLYEGQFVDQNQDSHLFKPNYLWLKDEPDPVVKKWCVRVENFADREKKSDLDCLTRNIQKKFAKPKIFYSLNALQRLPSALRREDGLLTLLLVDKPSQIQVIGIEAGDTADSYFGVAIDLGTTTIAVHLALLKTAEIVATAYDYNDQISNGQDIISRINFARKEGNLEILRSQALATINRLIETVANKQRILPEQICNAAISGNTTMIHLLLGLNPEYIRLEPYTPTLLEVPPLTAREIGIAIFPYTPITISPAVGSYVGGDITAGLLCTDLATQKEKVNLFIDIGTNGELVIGNREFLITCACSAGPAFEGGGIECGMRASRGAIEKVEIDAKSGKARIHTIGDTPPLGICGSGMISLLAGLFLTEWITPDGKLNRGRTSHSIRINGRKAEYVVAPGNRNQGNREIKISETDIENIIRAKAAIYSACALMLKQVGFDFKDLNKIYIGGGFGRYLDIESAITIGLIPDLPRDKYFYLGNSSLMGTVMCLVSEKSRQQQKEIAGQMTYIELNTDPAYMEQYTGALFLPHTDIDRFPSVKALLK